MLSVTTKKQLSLESQKIRDALETKSLPLKYYSQNKAWRTQSLWQEMTQSLSLDDEMGKQGRKIILFEDNADGHKTSVVF